MQFVIRQTPAAPPALSIVLLDWSCRESLHLLDCLAAQSAPRESYQIIWVEYYDKPNAQLVEGIGKARAAGAHPPVDVYAVLGMDRSTCYHKHLMMNAGLILAGGQVVCFMDSDAMVLPTFVQSILDAFKGRRDLVLHLDEARNNDPGFYPFSFPSAHDATGPGCINWLNGTTTGVLDRADPIHTRNYGACMAARREDLLRIGGADMHGDYLGHICGFYEMTFRLVNAGLSERWHDGEFLYHLWHPGQAGDQNYAGPHDGMQMSSRALEARAAGRVEPFAPSKAVAALRRKQMDESAALATLIEPDWPAQWRWDALSMVQKDYRLGSRTIQMRESAAAAPSPQASPVPLFGRRLSRRGRLRLLPLTAGMIWRQLAVKRRAARWSVYPKTSAPAEASRKIQALHGFLRRIVAYDKHWIRQCWRALTYAAQEGQTRVVLYGQGDAARVLCALAPFAGVRVEAICPLDDAPPPRLLGRPTLSDEQLAATRKSPPQPVVIVADFVAIPTHLATLSALGIAREGIITLQ